MRYEEGTYQPFKDTDPYGQEIGDIATLVAQMADVCWICKEPSIGAGVFVTDWRETDECDVRPICQRHFGWELAKIQMDTDLDHQGNGIYL